MKKLIAVLFGFVAAATALVPAMIAEAGMNMQHNETLVRERETT